MPSGPVAIAVADVSLTPELVLQQLKQCSTCHSPLLQTDMSTGASQFVSIPDLTDNAIVCGACRERLVAERQAARDAATLADLEQEIVEHELTRQLAQLPTNDTQMLDVENDYDFTPEPPARRPSSPVPPAPPVYIPLSAPPSHSQPFTNPSKAQTPTQNPRSPLSIPRTPHPLPSFVNRDPWQDVTQTRVRTQAHDCLYPGATFVGTQRSGRNAYEVTVTIVDVDLAASFLCGYLRISGLTEDHPELTTYFDSEIIGPRYGFLTEQDWGATETEDMTHWARFPAFRSVRPELRKPQLTMRQRDRGVVFMRWKEKFLLPDHRVKDIHGASFAGFYYVCVEFGSGAAPAARRSSSATDPAPCTHESGGDSVLTGASQREAFPSLSSQRPPPVAVMTGFYFHQHSEPYQQLKLHHVPERATSYFEFR